MRVFLAFLRKTDWLMVAIIFLLITIGLVIIYSIGKNSEIPSTAGFYKQLISAGIGLILFIVCIFISTRFLKSYAFIFYILGILLLIIVLFFGVEIGGTKGWLSVAGFTIQPIEISRVCLILFLAQFFSRKSAELDKMKNILISGLIMIPYIVLVLLQPDLGSVVILLLIWLAIIFN